MAGAAVADEATRWNAAAGREHAVPGVEEDEVERKPHAEGVDAGAAWDQQPAARRLSLQAREAQQAGAKARGDPHLPAEDAAARQAAKAAGDLRRLSHRAISRGGAHLSPTLGR